MKLSTQQTFRKLRKEGTTWIQIFEMQYFLTPKILQTMIFYSYEQSQNQFFGR